MKRLLSWLAQRQYGGVPGIVQIALAHLRFAFGVQWLYGYLHEQKRGALTRPQREMLATVVTDSLAAP